MRHDDDNRNEFLFLSTNRRANLSAGGYSFSPISFMILSNAFGVSFFIYFSIFVTPSSNAKKETDNFGSLRFALKSVKKDGLRGARARARLRGHMTST